MNAALTKWEAKFKNTKDGSTISFTTESETGNTLKGATAVYDKMRSLVATPDDWVEEGIRQTGRTEQPQAQVQAQPPQAAPKKKGFLAKLGEALTTD